MPQLDISTYSSQLFWLFVSLLVLVVTLHRVVIPQYITLIQTRKNTINAKIYDIEKIEASNHTRAAAIAEITRQSKEALRKLLSHERHALSQENISARAAIFAHERKRLRFEMKKIGNEALAMDKNLSGVRDDIHKHICKSWITGA
ncbi:MAG: hypothetical protein H6849_03145 [Alphaproteobacteria bacterium]|nr:MAG: hypothetical protein H6849_03145 [Alphaproteobacteria bacterium]